MNPLMYLMAGSHGHVTLTLTGATANSLDISAPKTAGAGFSFNMDGTVDDWDRNTGTTQISTATDWIIPNGSASSDYQMAYTSFSGSALTTDEFGGADTWVAMSENREVRIITDTDPEVLSCTFTMQVRRGTGPVLSSAVYTINAENGS